VSLLPLEIAGLRIDLAIPATEPKALARYRPFASGGGSPGWTIELRGEAADPPAAPGRSVIERGGRWHVAGAEQAGWLDPAGRVGEARCDPELLLVDTLIRTAVGAHLLSRGGLLVHGAAVAVDGAAHLFPARSGSGKSTLAARAGHPLSDEVSALEPGAGGFLVHATPWWISRGGAARLAGIYAIAWGGEGTAPLRRTAVRQIVTNLVLPLDSPVNRGRALAAAAAAAGSVPFARFSFQPDSDIDRLLRGRAVRARGVG
jgi:hypothetical protein